MNFKKGDRAMIKSGGPTMTIQEALPNGDCVCSWWDGTRHQCEVLNSCILMLIEDEGPSFVECDYDVL